MIWCSSRMMFIPARMTLLLPPLSLITSRFMMAISCHLGRLQSRSGVRLSLTLALNLPSERCRFLLLVCRGRQPGLQYSVRRRGRWPGCRRCSQRGRGTVDRPGWAPQPNTNLHVHWTPERSELFRRLVRNANRFKARTGDLSTPGFAHSLISTTAWIRLFLVSVHPWECVVSITAVYNHIQSVYLSKPDCPDAH
jgi:hypothetical protein